MSENKYTGFEIAVIGIACRVPGASNWREYWNNLKNNIESVKFLSEEELYELGVTDDVIKDKNFVGIGSDLKDKDCFDSSFFDYTPDEARLMNPEHRFFHECAWEALEDAGYNPDTMPGPVGIYAGAGVDVNWQAYSMFMNGNKNVNDFYLSKINNKDYLTSLVSYKLNLKGPSYYVHTACSTSLVAVHVACKALLFGEARVALAGGTAISSWKNKGYMYQEGGILSKDGHCRPFDKDSSGTIAGDGVGVVVLKRLSDAIKDGDQIYSIIKGSAVNNDGKRKVGYTAPSIEGQVECIRTAQKFAKVEPETISYVETHGTATKLGDSIEVEALNIAFKRNNNKHCSIGSVKSNIGHLDSAAGVAGLIKTILSLKYNKLPATLHFNAPDSEIDFNDGPFYVNTELKDWKRENNLPLRAGINSFGVGGTNVHVILEEPPIQVSGETQPRFNLFTISAKTDSSLNRYVERMKKFLEDEGSDINPADLCYTLQVGRKDFSFRKALAFTDIDNLKNSLRETDKKQLSVKSKDRRNSLVFMFPGQGSQYENMGKDLYENEIFFKTEMDKGFLLLEKITSLNFKTILYPDLAGKDQINETRYTQPLIFLFEYALARLIMSYGINPQYMIGHSIGEYVAACLSGVFSFEDALKLVVKRGELMNKLPEGVMVSVLSSADRIKEYLTDDISIAALNGPEQIVLSGAPQHINLFLEKLDNNNITYVKLRTSHAFHSQMLDPMLNEFKNELMKYKFSKPTHAFISNLTGKLITYEEAVSPEYWVKHVRQTVNFSDGVKFLLSQSNELLFIESGAGHSLSSLLKQQQNNKYTPVSVNLVRSVKEKENDEKFLINSIGKLWAQGITFNWNSYYKNETRRRISLPTYSFEPIKYTAEVDPFESGLLGGNIVKSKRELKDWIYYPSWKRSLLAPQEAIEKNKTFLVFSGEQPFFNSVINGLTNSNSEVIEICMGTGFLKHHKYKYSLDPLQPSHIKQLFSELLQENTEISDIVYAFATSSLRAGDLELNELNVSMNIFYLTFINIIKELVNSGVLKDQKITIVTNELYTVYGNEKINPGQSLLIGLINSLSQEHGLTCVNIDISLNQNSDLATNLVAELNRKYNVQERIISLRGNYRWVYEHQNNLEYTSEKNNTIKNNNTYLITGGLGNMGFLLAKHLITNYDIELILIGRTIINGNNEKNARLQHLRSISNKVNYFSTDISDSAKFEECIKDIEERFGAINGIVHVAGNVDRNNSELVSDITWQKSFNVFSAKIKGIENIYKVFKSRNLDFVWATSSLASALGGISFGAYSSANLFMENFIASKTAEIPNWKCIALPVVIFDEQNLKKEKERSFLKADELINLFEWSVQLRSTPVVLISVNDLYSVIHKAYSLQKEIYIEDDLTNVNTEKVERPNLNNAFLEATTDTERKLKEIFENLFGIEGIGIEDNFFDLGGDSLKGTILLKRINNVFNVEIALNELFTAPTIFEMAKVLDEKLWINTEVKTVNEIII